MPADEVERRVDELFQGPLEDFVARRNALAKELRTEDRGRSDEVKALRKPTVAAWGLDRAAHDDPDGVAELRAAGQAVERAQEAALAGDRGSLREASERRRAAIARLADAAAGHAGDGHRDEIEATLEAASVDPGLHAQLASARLTSTAEARAGFGDLAGLLAASTGGGGRAGARADADDADELAARRRRAEAERLRARLDDASADLEQAAAELERAEAAVDEAERRRDDAAARLDEATTARDALAAQLDALGDPD